MLDTYLTVKTNGSHEIIIQKSRFITHVKRTADEADAQHFIQSIKKAHYQASHNCSAYLIGDRDQFQKANDDGEPSGTAGVPMLEVLKKRQLKNVTVVVTRYFGGTKLGAGGLVRAYGSAVSETLNTIGIVRCELMTIVTCAVAYPLLPILENLLQKKALGIQKIDYSENVSLSIYVKHSEVSEISDWLINVTNGTANITIGDVLYQEHVVPC